MHHFVHLGQVVMPKCSSNHMFDEYEKKKGHKDVLPSLFHGLRLRYFKREKKH